MQLLFLYIRDSLTNTNLSINIEIHITWILTKTAKPPFDINKAQVLPRPTGHSLPSLFPCFFFTLKTCLLQHPASDENNRPDIVETVLHLLCWQQLINIIQIRVFISCLLMRMYLFTIYRQVEMLSGVHKTDMTIPIF